MDTRLLKKIMFSMTALTAFYLVFIFILHEDLTVPIKSWKKRLLVGFLLFITGTFIHRVLTHPELLELLIPMPYGLLNIRSGFIRNFIADTMIPLVAASILEISVTAAQISVIDKLLFCWRKKRLPYIFALAILSWLAVTSGATLYALIDGQENIIDQATYLLNIISIIGSAILSAIMLLLAIIIIVRAFMHKQKTL